MLLNRGQCGDAFVFEAKRARGTLNLLEPEIRRDILGPWVRLALIFCQQGAQLLIIVERLLKAFAPS